MLSSKVFKNIEKLEMQLNKSKVISTLVFFLAIPVSLWTQSSNSAVLLLQSLGARGVALGESYVAIADGIHSQYWNPAGLIFPKKDCNYLIPTDPSL